MQPRPPPSPAAGIAHSGFGWAERGCSCCLRSGDTQRGQPQPRPHGAADEMCPQYPCPGADLGAPWHTGHEVTSQNLPQSRLGLDGSKCFPLGEESGCGRCRRAIFHCGARSGVNGASYLANNPFINIVGLKKKKKEKRFVKLNSERSDLTTEVINF